MSNDPTPANIAVHLSAPESSLRWLAGASLAKIGGQNSFAAIEALLQ